MNIFQQLEQVREENKNLSTRIKDLEDENQHLSNELASVRAKNKVDSSGLLGMANKNLRELKKVQIKTAISELEFKINNIRMLLESI